MTIRITNLRIPLAKDKDDLGQSVAERLRLRGPDVQDIRITRKATDARRKPNISFVYTVDVDAKAESKVLAKFTHDKDVTLKIPKPEIALQIGSMLLKHPPVVVGMGPAGLFAALWLAKYGFRPIVLERGRDVDSRTRDVSLFWQGGEFNPESNVQFGEGGAGTFSDGKLTTRVNDPRTDEILQELIAAGAPPEIAYLHKPHIGTDRLQLVVKNIRKKIIALGGRVHFQSTVTDIYLEDKRVTGIEVNGATRLPCDMLFLGIGHSARDTYQLLYKRGIELEAKPISMGVRIEHPQNMIDVSQYGQAAGHPRLGAADYALVHHDKDTQRAVYSFCMCPGGQVVAAASEPGGVVVNGMSNYARNSGIANSALVVAVNPDDYGTTNPLGGMDFQRAWEQAAFRVGGNNYHAPAQRLDDFFAQRSSAGFKTELISSYRPSVTPADLHQCLPDFVTKTLANGLKDFGKKIRGFDGDDVIMTGVETRTSAPLRIRRSERFESVNTGGLYPIGEGAGYAGGITSAALDGLNAAIEVITRFRKPRE